MPLDLNREIDLKGEWCFEIGDNLDYARDDYNYSKWEKSFKIGHDQRSHSGV